MRSLHKVRIDNKNLDMVKPFQLVNDFSEKRKRKPPKEGEPVEAADAGQEEDAFSVFENEQFELAKQMVEDARKEAERIIKEAQKEAEALKEAAEQEGYVSGFKKGSKLGQSQAEAEGKRQWDEKLEAVESDVTEFLEGCTDEKQKILDQYIDDLKDLSISIAQKVIQVSMKSSGEIIKRMIISATDTLKKAEWAKIYIAKADTQFLAQTDVALMGNLKRLSDNVKIIPVENSESGTCIIELPNQIIDASVNTQLDNIRDIIHGMR